MIVEVFYRKSPHFTEVYDTFWSVKKIAQDGGNFILTFEDSIETVLLSVEEYELRCSY